MTVLNYGAGLNSAPSGIQRSLGVAGQLQGLQANQQNMNQNQTVFDQNQQALIDAKKQQALQAQQKQATLQEGGRLLQEGTPDEIADFMFKNPDVRKQFIESANFKDGSSLASRADYAKSVVSDQVDPIQAITQRIEEVEASGGDAQGLKRTLATNDPAQIKLAAEKDLAMIDNDSFNNYRESIGVASPEKGTFIIKETPSGFIKLNSATGQITEMANDSKIAKAQSDKEKAELKSELDATETTFKRAGTIRNRYDKKINAFEKVRDAYSRIQASAESPDAAGDMALIFNYMKMLDPGSTVMEGEFRTAAGAASVPERLKGVYNRVLSGENLTPKQRAEFVGRAGKLMTTARAQKVKDEGDAIALGAQYGVTESDLFGNPLARPENAVLVEQLKAAGQTEEQINTALGL